MATGGCDGTPVRNIAVLGHSFVAYLPEYHQPPIHVTLLAKPGATVDSLKESSAWEELVDLRPELTFLIIGGNDIHHGIVPKDLAYAINDLAESVEQVTGGACMVVGIEKRPNPRGLSGKEFNTIRNGVNRWLKRDIPFTRARYMSMDTVQGDFRSDGIHLTQEASRRLLLKFIDVSLTK